MHTAYTTTLLQNSIRRLIIYGTVDVDECNAP